MPVKVLAATWYLEACGTGGTRRIGSGSPCKAVKEERRSYSHGPIRNSVFSAGYGRTRYRPTKALRDLVNARDQRCCGPACNRPAATWEFDHTIPFREPEGKTAYDSAGPACKFHNDIKEHGWTVTQPTPGRFLWTSPTGRMYDVTPNDEYPPPPF
ncbi:hypothetical protein GCM10009765_02040 [Fodinicola feengrottensis]|uniref:HNH endonuclease n=1 Tax=Fodinicola feengrottensis TaxID=435914 RepID=A0ABN2FQ47_9ACTN